MKQLNNFNFNNNNEILNNININLKEEEEEEEEEDDEEELAENLDRLDCDKEDLEDLLKEELNANNNIISNIDFGERKENEEREELFDENDNDLKKLIPLNEEKFNYLLNSRINFSE